MPKDNPNSYNNTSTPELLRALKQNDEASLRYFYQKNYAKVERYVKNNSGTDDEARDIYQDAFIAVWRNIQLDRFQPQNDTALDGYIYQIAKNKWLDRLRAAKRVQMVELTELNGGADTLPENNEEEEQRTFEEWTVKLTASKVSLKATKEVVVPYEPSTISAVIKNLGDTGDTHPYFEWKTSGKYGTLSDTKGHTQQISFGSADADVTYVSRQNVSESTENIEYVYVTAFYQNKEIGKDTITLNVKKDKYTISPDGVTLSGQDGETHSAALYLVKPDGTSGIGSSPDFDYKIVWTTGGTYGKLSGNKTSVTNYNNNRITFTVFDDKTKEATQKVSARVYLKKKSEPESAYILTSEDDVSIKINNDDKKKIVHYSLIAMHFDELTGPVKDSHFRDFWYHGCANQGLVPVKEEKDAVSYSLTFMGGIVRGAPTGYNWTPENLSFSGPSNMPGSPGKYSNGTYYAFYTGLGSSASPTYTPTLCCHSPSDSKYITGVKAEVVITLK